MNRGRGSLGYRGHDEEGYRWTWDLGYKGAGGEQGYKGTGASIINRGAGGFHDGHGCRSG